MHSALSDQYFVWMHTVYGELSEILPSDAPEPLSEHVTVTHYIDANLMHDITTGKAVTGINHLLNQTLLIGTPRKRQPWRLPHIALTLWLPIPALRRLLIFDAPLL